MKIARVRTREGNVACGIVRDESVFLVEGDALGARRETGTRLALSDVTLLAPIVPPNILCFGRNYKAHAEEGGDDIPKAPLMFIKATSCLAGPGDPIVIPNIAPEQVDYEAELAVVIGKAARHVSESDALDHVLGFTCANDVSARDAQNGDGQWARGKSFETFGPLGPWIETDLDPSNIRVRGRLNGKVMQDASTRLMIFSIPHLISYLSRGMTLLPGSVLLTGTPAGCGFAQSPPRWLRPGDTYEVEIEGIGTLENSVVEEAWPMAQHKVAVTDYTFETLDAETEILEPLGCEVVGQKTGKDPRALAALVADADCVITQFAPVNAAIVAAMDRCQVIVRYGIGVDNVDLLAAAERGIPVCNVPDYCIDEVADHALAMILDLSRRITANAAKVKAGGWGLAVPLGALHALRDLTVGVVAFGRIGREVAARLRAFKCKVLVYDPIVDPAVIAAGGCMPVGLGELLATSDLVTLHCPSTDQTRGMINAKSIATMKPGALLVNTSRGNLVVTDDLIAALRAGTISAAALDVTDPEPIDPASPLVAMDNVIITAHIASASPQAVDRLRKQAAGTVALALQGKPLPNVVNGVTS